MTADNTDSREDNALPDEGRTLDLSVPDTFEVPDGEKDPQMPQMGEAEEPDLPWGKSVDD